MLNGGNKDFTVALLPLCAVSLCHFMVKNCTHRQFAQISVLQMCCSSFPGLKKYAVYCSVFKHLIGRACHKCMQQEKVAAVISWMQHIILVYCGRVIKDENEMARKQDREQTHTKSCFCHCIVFATSPFHLYLPTNNSHELYFAMPLALYQ